MAKVTLGDIVKLAKESENKISKLYQRINEVSTSTYVQGEEDEKPEISVDELFKQIEFHQGKVRYLRQLVAKTNIETYTDFDWKGLISQAEAIVLLSQLLGMKSSLERLSNNRPKVRVNDIFNRSNNGITQWTVVTYDIEDMKKRYSELEKNIRALRTAIDRVNINTILEIPDEYFEF